MYYIDIIAISDQSKEIQYNTLQYFTSTILTLLQNNQEDITSVTYLLYDSLSILYTSYTYLPCSIYLMTM